MDYFAAIRGLASSASMSMTALAEAVGHAPSYVASYEAHGRVPSLTVAAKLAAPLGYGLALVPLDADPEALDALHAIPLDAPPRDA